MEHSSTQPSKRRPNFPLDFKIKLVEQALQPGVSIAALAREHGINDNLLFNWRQLYLRGKFGIQPKSPEEKTTSLLPVALAAEPARTTPVLSPPPTEYCACDIEFPHARLRLSNLTPVLLHTLIQELKRGPL